MNLRWLLFLILMLSGLLRLSAAWYETRTFHYLGDKTHRHQVDPQERAESVKKAGVEFLRLGWRYEEQPLGEHGMYYGSALSLKSSLTAQSIMVEDVADPQPVTLILDQAPKLEKQIWLKEADRIEVNRTSMPWAYEKGDVWRTYRITVKTAKHGEIVFLQPQLVRQFEKVGLTVGMTEMLKSLGVSDMPGQKSDPTHERFLRSANALLTDGRMYITLDLMCQPTDTTVKDAIKGMGRAWQSRAPFVIASMNRDWAYELVTRLIDDGGNRAFKKIKRVVIAPDSDPERYAQLEKQYSVEIMTGPLLD